MYQVLRQFEIDPARADDFEAAYGAEGLWAVLYRDATGYLGRELFRAIGEPGRYLAIDRWDSRAACETFRGASADDQAATDAMCAGLTERELPLGAIGE